jgi:para-aminobenzoate synthetase / 4-amino-4-deoxychorismate lyase
LSSGEGQLRIVDLSGLNAATNFALLAPGYSSGTWTLIEDVRPTDSDEALLWLFPYASERPLRFTGRPSKVDVHFDCLTPMLVVHLEDHHAIDAIESIRASIARGDVYQVNLTLRASIDNVSGAQLLQRLCAKQTPRFASWLKIDGVPETVSASPELLFETAEGVIRVEPMKGTAALVDRSRLLQSVKDQAELAMITDLLRDDLHQLCRPGTVSVTNPRLLVELPYALQTVSQVSGTLEPSVNLARIYQVLHPGGSVTGAPRKAARDIIDALETSPRGLYCGSLGLSLAGTCRSALLIRTAQRETAQRWVYGVGSGITWDSEAQQELDEMHLKLGALT